jgi:protein involved in polysaccharide export with SLBB domain
MQPGKERSSWRSWVLLGPILGLLAGCAAGRSRFEQALLTDRTPEAHDANLYSQYAVHCPDVLEVAIEGRPAWNGRRRIGPDGRLWLGEAGSLRVNGATVPEITRALAELADIPMERVHVAVLEFNSEQLYLFGEVAGPARAVPYQGPETILNLLQRVGGITPGAALNDVRVVRPHVADGKTPEVFQVDLAAIVLKKDQHTNLHLEPGDQIYVGPTGKSNVARCLPPWLQPFFKTVCGLSRP